MSREKIDYHSIGHTVMTVVLFLCVASVVIEGIRNYTHIQVLELTHNKAFAIDSVKSAYQYDEERYKNENFRLRQIIRNHPGIEP